MLIGGSTVHLHLKRNLKLLIWLRVMHTTQLNLIYSSIAILMIWVKIQLYPGHFTLQIQATVQVLYQFISLNFEIFIISHFESKEYAQSFIAIWYSEIKNYNYNNPDFSARIYFDFKNLFSFIQFYFTIYFIKFQKLVISLRNV